jgi:hypothetical protein
MIDTLWITQKQLDKMKDYIIQYRKPWSVDAKLMHDDHMILWEVTIEGQMTYSEAFHFGMTIEGTI